jgi:hypothetical protein
MNRYIMIRRLRWPALLFLVGVIALLAQTHVLRWGQSWPLFLIVFGVLLLAERAALATEAFPPYLGGPSQVATQGAPPNGTQSASTAIVPSEPQAHGDDGSGVQS